MKSPQKVIFDHGSPYWLAHGGFQVQIDGTKKGLEQLGVEVEYGRWWEKQQPADLIHYWGIAPLPYLDAARVKKIPVVMTTLFTETCNRPESQLRRQGLIVQSILKLPFGEGVKRQLTWRSFEACARNVVGLKAEQRVLELVYKIPPERISIVPLGLSEDFLNADPASRSADHLVCVGTITQRKNCVLLANFARETKSPILFVGKPYSNSDPYWLEFQNLIDGQFVRHQPHVENTQELISILQQARGAVIGSWYENWCLAAHEAAACGLPLLLPQQAWAQECFGSAATYFGSDQALSLKSFYQACPELQAPKIKLYSWTEAAERLLPAYQSAMSHSR